MADPHFLIPIVEPKYLKAWHEYRQSPNPSKATLRAHKFGHLEKTVNGRAATAQEVADLAEAWNPGFVVVREAITMIQEPHA